MNKSVIFLTVMLIGISLVLVFGTGANSLGKFTTANASGLFLQDPTEVPNPIENNGRIKPATIEGHGNIYDLAWSPDGRRLAVADAFGVWVYNMEEVDKVPLFIDSQDKHVFAVSFAYDNVILGYGDDTGSMHLWDINDSVELAQIQTHVGTIWDIDFSMEDSFVLAGDNGEVQLRDLKTGRLLSAVTISLPVYSVAFSPTGTLVSFVNGAPDFDFQARVFIWDVERDEWEVVFWSKNALLFRVAFDRTGEVLAFGGASLGKDGVVQVVDLLDNTQLVELIAPGSYVNTIAFSPSDNTMAYATGDSKINLWKLGDSLEPERLYEGSENITSLVFSPDGSFLASGGSDGIIRLWFMK